MEYITFFLLSAFAALLLAPSAIKKTAELGLVDHPDDRKQHNGAIPLAGGPVLFPFIVFGSLISFYDQSYLFYLMAGSSLILLLGIWDDRFGAHFLVKLIVQGVAALLIMESGLFFNLDNILFFKKMGLEFGPFWSTAVTLVWIVGITNAVNVIDGMDGLAAGICFNAFAGMGALALVAGPPEMAVFCVIMSGAILGFLRYNVHPARTFLGDSGSMLLGFTLAVLSISQSFKTTTFLVFVIPALLLALPMLDTFFAFTRRSVNGKNPFKADRGHLHHRLLELNFSQRQTLGLFYSLSAGMGVIALWLAQTSRMQILALAVSILVLTLAVIKVMQVYSFHEAIRNLNRRMRIIAKRAVGRERPGEERLVRNYYVLGMIIVINLLVAFLAPQKGAALVLASLGIFAIASLDVYLSRNEEKARYEILHVALFASLVINQIAILVFWHRDSLVAPHIAISAFLVLVLIALFIYRTGTFAAFLQDPMEILALYLGLIICGIAKHILNVPSILPLAIALVNALVLYFLLKIYLSNYRVRSWTHALGFTSCIALLVSISWLR